jgi:hypothetical protein
MIFSDEGRLILCRKQPALNGTKVPFSKEPTLVPMAGPTVSSSIVRCYM